MEWILCELNVGSGVMAIVANRHGMSMLHMGYYYGEKR